MNDLKTRLTHIVASKPELLKNLNISIPQIWKFVDHLIANGIRVPVFCKDCIYYEIGKDYEPYCNHVTHGIPYPKADDFCSYGERKDNE